MRVGVLGLQGDVSEHVDALSKLDGVDVVIVKKASDLKNVDKLVIPGGESTTVGKLIQKYGIDKAVKKIPIFGTCTGAILLARRINTGQFSLKLMDIEVERNAYGRQKESFEAEISIPALGKKKFKAVFIRAPVIKKVGKGAEVLARLNGNPVLVKHGALLAATFHPELTEDTRLHEYFLKLV